MNKNPFTYKKSGVDIDAADKFIKFISSISSKKRGKKKFNNIGGFGSISNLPNNIKKPKIIEIKMIPVKNNIENKKFLIIFVKS